MTGDYVQNYIQAIDNPLPKLRETFAKELEILRAHSSIDSTALDVGCGAGRPANTFSGFVKKLICVDNDPNMLALAEKRCNNTNNVDILKDDALNLTFSESSFDLVYATYNLVGSLKKSERQRLIDEMRRVASNGSKIINITWKDDVETTEFLKEYYPSIGIQVFESDNSRTVTSKGTFERISKNELLGYYNSAKLKDIQFVDVGPVWTAVIGVK